MLISEEQKLDAWRWLCREALAGNSKAVTVLIDWSSGDMHDDEIESDLDQMAVTLQWWLDFYDQDKGAAPTDTIVPPKYPTVQQVATWVRALWDTIAAIGNGGYAHALNDIRRELDNWINDAARSQRLVDRSHLNPEARIIRSDWPTRDKLTRWISVLASVKQTLSR